MAGRSKSGPGGAGERTVIRRPDPGKRREAVLDRAAGRALRDPLNRTQVRRVRQPERPPEPERPAAPAVDRTVSRGARQRSEEAIANPLLDESGEILTTLLHIGRLPTYHDIESLRDYFVTAIEKFVDRVLVAGIPRETAEDAKYILSGFVDEVIMNTPWGAGFWTENNLAIRFGYDLYAGEEFFRILDRAASASGRDLDLLEFMYVCLSLGFKGEYAYTEDAEGLRRKRRWVFEIIDQRRDIYGKELSPHWRSPVKETKPLSQYVPFWVIGAVGLAVITSIYFGYAFALHAVSDPVLEETEVLAREPLVRRTALPSAPLVSPLPTPPDEKPPGRPPPRPPDGLKLPPPLLPEPVLITFETAGARLDEEDTQRLAGVLAQLREDPALRIEVLGRTDYTGTAAVNARLSKERATVVYDYLMKAGVDASRVERVAGLSDSDPLTPPKREDFKRANRSTQIVYAKPTK
jgi:type VI secretion system protein ImpK